MFGLIMTALAYLLGSVSSGILVCKWMKIEDPRQYGSNNPGATNVLLKDLCLRLNNRRRCSMVWMIGIKNNMGSRAWLSACNPVTSMMLPLSRPPSIFLSNTFLRASHPCVEIVFVRTANFSIVTCLHSSRIFIIVILTLAR